MENYLKPTYGNVTDKVVDEYLSDADKEENTRRFNDASKAKMTALTALNDYERDCAGLLHVQPDPETVSGLQLVIDNAEKERRKALSDLQGNATGTKKVTIKAPLDMSKLPLQEHVFHEWHEWVKGTVKIESNHTCQSVSI